MRRALGIDGDRTPVFGWKARVPLANGRTDRTEVDMRWGGLLVEAKLTESGFQTRAAAIVEAYRDFDAVFDRELLPRVLLAAGRRKEATEFPEDYSQEEDYPQEPEPSHGIAARGSRLFPEPLPASVAEIAARLVAAAAPRPPDAAIPAYANYQLIRNVLAAQAEDCSFCVLCDRRRPDLLEAWFQVMAAVREAQLRVRLKVLAWQELAALLPAPLQEFLDLKYGIAAPAASPCRSVNSTFGFSIYSPAHPFRVFQRNGWVYAVLGKIL